uniref:head-tail connector protein n=1 Tax=Ningiella ruwaisensis TaxID=2364274 RepID=UPI0010A05635|nr:head-tail connector protein [Ningiella ruwaisensis]
MISVAECRLQCNLDQDEHDFDIWFEQVIPSAILAIQNLINRKIYATQQDLDDDENAPGNAIVFNESLRLGALMLIGHWFINRESTSALSLNETPMALDYLVRPYRHMAGVA